MRLHFMIILFLLFFNTAINAQVQTIWPRNFIDSAAALEPGMKNYLTRTPCDKIYVLDSLAYMNKGTPPLNKKTILMIKDLEYITQHVSNFSVKHPGYATEYVWENFYMDLFDWKTILNCQ
jgi:hypothetical protein